MKKFVACVFAILLLASGNFSRVFADDPAVNLGQNGLPDAVKISANCFSAQNLIGEIERADSVSRVNLGTDYNEILNLFFAMNARLNSNNISAPRLAEIVNNFQNKLNDFRDAYNKYDDSLGALTSGNCAENPEKFYANLLNSRNLAAVLNQNVTDLQGIVSDYRTNLALALPQNLDAEAAK